MASANVELVRSIVATWKRGDYSSADWAHPEIEVVFADGPSPGSWRGVAGLTEGWRNFLSAWEDYRSEVEEFRELDGERVLVLTHRSGRGKQSGVALEQMNAKGAGLYEVRGGKVTRAVFYFDREHALADLDLPPEVGSQRS